MGQNIVGVPRITIANGRAGGRITLRFSEMLYPNLKASGANVGTLMTENYRAALSQDVYTMKAGPQVLQPRFTSHGYQYVELTGIGKALPLASVEGLAISSVRKLSADYKTSDAKVNRLYNRLGLADRTAIEYFDGPHTIHGVGTFRFLHRHLSWPEPVGRPRP